MVGGGLITLEKVERYSTALPRGSGVRLTSGAPRSRRRLRAFATSPYRLLQTLLPLTFRSSPRLTSCRNLALPLSSWSERRN